MNENTNNKPENPRVYPGTEPGSTLKHQGIIRV